MAIGDSIYLLYADGQIRRLTVGQPDTFDASDWDTPPSSPSALFTRPPEETQWLYLGDRGHGRIVQAGKEGAFKQQFRLSDAQSAENGDPLGQLSSLFLSLLLVTLIVAALFRSLTAGLLSGGTLGLAMAFLFGLMGLLGIELNLPTALLSSIMIGVGVDYTIHFLWRYREERRQGGDPAHAVYRTLTTSGRGIIINALSVVLGFAVMLISAFVPVRYFGFLVLVSISACLLGAMVLIPAVVLQLRPRFLEPTK